MASEPRAAARRLTKAKFLEELAQTASSLRARIDADVDAFPVDEAARRARVARVSDPVDGFRFFCQTYFPHYIKSAPSLLHQHLYEDLPTLVAPGKTRGRKLLKIAPRGSAKSTIGTQLFSLWAALLRKKRFIIIAMDVWEQAALMLEAIKVELESNPRLAMDFPDASGAGRRWREGEIVTRTDVMFLAAGARQKLRGRRFGPFRPDLVILDDMENDENVTSPEYRQKLESWVLKVVCELGPPDGSMDLIMVGTILHHDAVLVRLSRKPGFTATKFKALVRDPDRMDLWEQWQEIYLNDSEDAADSFYDEHRAEMDAGALLNWPEVKPLLLLMKARATSFSSFMSEQQGEPVSEGAPFTHLTFWVQRRHDWIFFGGVDPSLGKKGKGRDPSAILVAALDRSSSTPVLDVVEASIRRRLPDVIIADVIAMQREFGCALWFVEAIQFQEFLRSELMSRALREGVPLPAIPVQPITDKTLRIERLQPPIAGGLIRFSQHQAVLLEQLRQWPNGDHDDGPDCLEMLWTGAITYGVGAVTSASLPQFSGGRPDTFGGYRL
ncbi:phage terminase large subunit [Xanthobacter sp. VTT E-85241]|uniref:phage terminase large subunit n=1 Tax=Roseixanthobacter finlandensis TaxID=3119922 RepID=UPI00372A7593